MADLTRAFVEEVLHKSNSYRHVRLTTAQKAELCRAWLTLDDARQQQPARAAIAATEANPEGKKP